MNGARNSRSKDSILWTKEKKAFVEFCDRLELWGIFTTPTDETETSVSKKEKKKRHRDDNVTKKQMHTKIQK